MNKVCLSWKNDPKDYLVATSNDAANWTEVSIATVRGNCLIFGSVMARYIGVFPLIDGVDLLDRTVELLDFQVYLAGPYVNYGTYTSMPYQASSNQVWQIPYPRDSYDIRLHFKHFNTQGSANGYPFHDELRIYDEVTGLLYKKLYGSYGAGGTSSLGGDSLIPDNDPTNEIIPGPDGGFRTNWLFCESAIPGCIATGSVPSKIEPTKLGTRIKLMWEGPLAYDPTVTGWILDGYELYTKINPTMIQVDIGAARGTGRNKREVHLSTKIQPPNLLLKGSD